MKKLLTTFASVVALSSTLSADIARLEMGAGSFMQTPSGIVEYNDPFGFSKDTDNMTEEQQNNVYVWALLKHPLPIIPNIRAEYVTITADATNKATVSGSPLSIPVDASISTGSSSVLNMSEIDVIPYYNLLDNTAWITLDVGLDLKIMDLSYEADSIEVVPDDVKNLVLPLAYVRGRVEIPFTGLGLESDVKYLSYDTATLYDVRAKVDYTFTFIPVVQPAVEVGYRVQKIDYEDSGFLIDTEFSGVYAGLMLRF